jgi:hypothetical protein
MRAELQFAWTLGWICLAGGVGAVILGLCGV